jgi:hypothetical protein
MDKLVGEYTVLQNMHAAIENSEPASKLVSPVSYHKELADTRQGAAEAYYQEASNYLENNTREYARKAYGAYKKVGTFVRDYKDSKAKMERGL